MGISPYDQTARACVDPALACDRANLPARHKGIGLPRHADVCFAAFVGGIELAVPRFGQRALEDGSILPGLAENLVEAVGTGHDFAKSEDRYKEFIASGLPLAKAFAECWEHMRTETGALTGSVFEAAAKDAPGQPPAEDIPQHHTGKSLLQRFCTRARMRLRHAGVARRMALLPHDEPPQSSV